MLCFFTGLCCNHSDWVVLQFWLFFFSNMIQWLVEEMVENKVILFIKQVFKLKKKRKLEISTITRDMASWKLSIRIKGSSFAKYGAKKILLFLLYNSWISIMLRDTSLFLVHLYLSFEHLSNIFSHGHYLPYFFYWTTFSDTWFYCFNV